ncbi:hypothetical protein NDU88_006190 [Pleurodeles waltl]|uniref:Uncharacterized protein n=1 Tax=Pleurodeles waltl TaxID=8319 RepID=A0AAV7PHK8_PLEWA|nr:hypothetical protein NDU88_006190 [Pleurodeles waltl]
MCQHNRPYQVSQTIKTCQKSQLVHCRAEIHQTQLAATRKEVAHQQRDRRTSTYKTALNQYNCLLKETKKYALADLIEISTNRSKELFAIVKEFTNPAATKIDITSSQELCDTLA